MTSEEKKEISSAFLNPKNASEQTKNYLKKLITEKPEYALSAIRLRNEKINELKSTIEHLLISAEEMAERMNNINKDKENDIKVLNENEIEIKELSEKYLETEKKFKELSIINGELTTKYSALNYAFDSLIKEKQNSISYKLYTIVENLPSWTPAIIKLFLSLLVHPVFSKYTILVSFLLTLWASFVGWSYIISLIKPFLSLISFGG